MTYGENHGAQILRDIHESQQEFLLYREKLSHELIVKTKIK